MVQLVLDVNHGLWVFMDTVSRLDKQMSEVGQK